MNSPQINYSACAKGTDIAVFNAYNGQRLYTIPLGSSLKITSGPFVNGDTISVYVADSSGSQYLKVIDAKTGIIKFTSNV